MVTNESGWRTLLGAVAVEVERRGDQAWLVGGCLRDTLRGWPTRDIDLSLAGDPMGLAHAVAAALPGAVVVPLPHGVRAARLVWPGGDGALAPHIDIAGLRGATIVEDLAARDFTIDALAMPLPAWPSFLALAQDRASPSSAPQHPLPDLLDPLDGMADLRAGVLRAASVHALADDPLRVLRGARLATWLGLVIAPETETLARAAAPALSRVAAERVGEELWGLLALTDAARGLAWLHAQGALAPVLPELAAPGTGPAHAVATVAALDSVRADLVDALDVAVRERLDAWYAGEMSGTRTRWQTLRWAALLHGISEHAAHAATTGALPAHTSTRDTPRERSPEFAPAARVAKRMGLSARERGVVRAVAAYHALPASLAAMEQSGAVTEDRLARRFFARTGEAGVDVLLIALACALAHTQTDAIAAPASEDRLLALARRLVTLFFLDRDRVLPPPLVDGTVLATQLGREPGPWLGRMLDAIRAAQVEGAVTTADDALRLARELSASHHE
jgi:poly(A) polymerase